MMPLTVCPELGVKKIERGMNRGKGRSPKLGANLL